MTSLQKFTTSTTTTAVLWWVNVYTRSLPGDVAQGRRDELLSDVYEQLANGERKELSRGCLSASSGDLVRAQARPSLLPEEGR